MVHIGMVIDATRICLAIYWLRIEGLSRGVEAPLKLQLELEKAVLYRIFSVFSELETRLSDIDWGP